MASSMLQLLLILFISAGCLFNSEIEASQETSFIIENDTFYRDGKPFRILGGEIHYFRIVPEYWKDRILRAKAMGLNTLQTYIPWNLHEPVQGYFSFSGASDLQAFLRLAQDLGMLVMLRIGPYVCGEWDFGGFPAWLLSKQPALKLRTSDSVYLQLVDDWWDVLLPKLVPFLYSHGGPVIMIQIENEYGSYGSDKVYLHHLALQARKNLGEDVILYTTDGATDETLQAGTIVQDNVYAAVDYSTGWDPVTAFALQRKYNLPGKSPALTAEFYTGWLTHWGEKLAQTSAVGTAMELDRALEANGSVVLYMAHGGSNFGFYSGANTGNKETIYQPDITSYDYDAPIGEGGDLGEKYYAMRAVFEKYADSPLPDPPALPQRASLGAIPLYKLAPLFEVLETLTRGLYIQTPVAMEILNQTSGFIVYRTMSPVCYTSEEKLLTINKVHDRAQVFLGENVHGLRFAGTIERWSNSSIHLSLVPGDHIFILVENMGRVNYGQFIYDPKGIISQVLLDHVQVTGWIAYSLSFTNPNDLKKLERNVSRTRLLKLYTYKASYKQTGTPSFYSGTIVMDFPADTFISFKGWNKGVAFLNGFNLGRFWPAAGPQCTLYVSGPLLKAGKNSLIILELETTLSSSKSVELKDEHDWSCSNSHS